MAQDPHSSDPLEDSRVGFNWLCLGIDSYAFVPKVFLHGNFGARAFGARAFVAWIIIMVHGMWWFPEDATPLGILWCLYFGMCLLHGIHRHVRCLRGTLYSTHSRYDGTPFIMRYFPLWSEMRIKQVLEPAILVAIGILLGVWNGPLGSFLIVAGVCQSVGYSFGQVIDQERQLDMNDQLLEMQYHSDRMRRR